MSFNIKDIITVDLLKKSMLTGVSLNDANGDPYPDELFDLAIDSAIAGIEQELEINIDSFSVKGERHDAIAQNRRSWWSMVMDRRPLKSFEKITISYGHYPETSVPLEWVNINSEVGAHISLIPTAAVLGSFNFSNSIPLLIDPISNFAYHDRVPSYFKMDYSSGFNFIEGQMTISAGETQSDEILFNETLVDKPNFIFEVLDNGGNIVDQVCKAINISNESFKIELNEAGIGDVVIGYKIHTVPQTIIKAILYTASFLPLDTAGDLIAGAGIAEFSLSIDDLSQNVRTTSSAENSGYSAKMKSYQSQLKILLKALKAKYQIPKIAVF